MLPKLINLINNIISWHYYNKEKVTLSVQLEV